MFDRSWNIFKKIRAQTKLNEALMGKDKNTIHYELKFGYGSSYREKITNKSISQIIAACKS